MNSVTTRQQRFTELFPKEKSFRWKQILTALYDPNIKSWEEVSTLGKEMRETLQKEISWFSHTVQTVLSGEKQDTYKALLKLSDGKLIETVLMENRRGGWTICVSSQVGCAMDCQFCATGKMGLIRNLTADEIMDQYRFWNRFLVERPDLPQRISNVVFMGMGEPMGNYENVKETIRTWLDYTDLGPTYITVSTVGVLPMLEKILEDKEWPHVRIAISLHSADPVTRKLIVPTSYDDFLSKLESWCQRYLKILGNRRHYLTFEYVMLDGINDTDHHAEALAKFAQKISHSKFNLIPYNFTDSVYKKSSDEQIQRFMHILQQNGVDVTRRKTMGDDIAAACGQLVTKEKGIEKNDL